MSRKIISVFLKENNMPHKQTSMDWEKEFHTLFPYSWIEFRENRSNVDMMAEIKSFIEKTLETQRREMVDILVQEKLIEAIFPGQSPEKLQMKAWFNKKIDRIVALLQNK